MQYKVIEHIKLIDSSEWNRIAGCQYPFTRHEFLLALEQNGCIGDEFGWWPHFVVAYDDGKLVGAVPVYLKDNSYGELVFDGVWAEAYKRAGRNYYPKYVIGIPYTPATGPRILVKASHEKQNEIRIGLIQRVQQLAEQSGVSSLHWLFTDAKDTAILKEQGLMLRLGCQFHWRNQGYKNFDDYLQSFSAAKRKKIKRERRRVKEQGIELEILHGHEISEEQWQIYHNFYLDTFDRKWGIATLSLGFFKQLGRTMPDNVVIVFAKYQGQYVASTFNIRGENTLYGRHWGCNADFHSLHFEACYYQGLDYCIQHGLQHFEPGAQGEHKISRGFLPTRTWSAHWIADPEYKQAISTFCAQEQQEMEHYIKELKTHSPFKAISDA